MAPMNKCSSMLSCLSSASLNGVLSLLGATLFLFVSGVALLQPRSVAGVFTAQAAPVTVVSAASYGSTLAPVSIAAAFGARLATQNATASGDADPNTPGVQLPKQLGGTTVTIGGQQAELFFVSAGQVNLMLPANLASGPNTITIRAGDGTVSTGTVTIAPVAPALFSASSNGQGAPAGLLLRVSATGAQQFEALAQLNTQNKWVPKPFTFNAAGERLFLVLFLSGLRGALDPDRNGNLNETVHVLLGGNEVTPDFVGKQGGLVGVDQLNAEIPRSLMGRGAVSLAVAYSSLATSNLATIEIGGTAATPSPVNVSSLNPTEALIGEEVILNGANFAGNPADNQVFFVDDQEGKNFRATVRSATTTQLRVIVPFGAGTGRALVRTPQSETLSTARLSLRTSISGFVEATDKQPLPGVAVRVRDTNISTTTSAEGAFILPNVPAAPLWEVEINPPAGARLPFPKYTAKLRVRAGRDHHFGHITLQQQTGPTIAFPNPNVVVGTAATAESQSATFAPTTRSIQTGGVIFEVADNTTALFPGGTTSGGIQLDVVANSRTPAKLPPGVFSSTIAQLAPFGVKLTPGGKLIFPNSDNLPVNAQPKLYKLDQTLGSPTLGEFIEAGAATVSTDGRRVETAANAIIETSLYFVAVPRPVTNVIGRVVEADGKVVRNAQVSTRGQEATTDGLGQYLLLNVPVASANDLLTLEASFQRPGGRVDQVSRNGIAPVLNGVTRVTDLVLPSSATQPNRPPTLIATPTLSATQNTPLDVSIVASDPDAGQTLQVTVTGAPFVSVVQNGSNYVLRLTPGAGTTGNYTLTLRAADNLGLSTTRTVALTVFANRAPVLSVPDAQTVSVGQTLSFNVIASELDAGQTLTLTATGLPSGAAFNQTSATTGQFMWTPSANQMGMFTVNFTVADNGIPVLSDTESVSIDVSNLAVTWAQGGKFGGAQVYAFLPISGSLFVSTSDGVFRSGNGGVSWTSVSIVADTAFVNSFVAIGTTLFAGTNNGAVYRSTNNGVNWTSIYNVVSGGQVSSLAAVGNTLFAAISGAIHRSADNGANWVTVNNGLGNPSVSNLAVIGTVLFAGAGNGVFRTTNNGANWTQINNSGAYALAVSGTTLYASIGQYQVSRSTDNGASWMQVGSLPGYYITSITLNGASLFVSTSNGAYRTIDNGANWTEMNNGLDYLSTQALTVIGTTVFIGTAGGVYSTTDNGVNWTHLNNGIGSVPVSVLALNGTTLFAGASSNGIYRSLDNAANWNLMRDGVSLQPHVYAFAVSGSGFHAATDKGVFRSTNNGTTWVPINNGLGQQPIPIYALTANGATLFAGTSTNGVFRSTDNGANWENVLGGRSITYLGVIGTTVYASTDLGLYRSTDNGATWGPINNGLNGASVTSLATVGTVLFAGTSSGVYRTPDNGANWIASSNTPGFVPVSALAASGTTLFASYPNYGVYRTTDNGANWNPINEGLTTPQVTAMLLLGNKLFVGTASNCVFVRPLL